MLDKMHSYCGRLLLLSSLGVSRKSNRFYKQVLPWITRKHGNCNCRSTGQHEWFKLHITGVSTFILLDLYKIETSIATVRPVGIIQLNTKGAMRRQHCNFDDCCAHFGKVLGILSRSLESPSQTAWYTFYSLVKASMKHRCNGAFIRIEYSFGKRLEFICLAPQFISRKSSHF